MPVTEWEVDMQDELEERIRHRAREIWQASGYPEGRSEEFWLQAEQEIRGEKETYDRLKSDPNVTTNS
jgi:pyruvate/2-oxoacid:ferredoxin oxidoreductase beta subunit